MNIKQTTDRQAMDVVLPGVVAPDGLVLEHRPIAEPGPDQVRVRVEASGVSFAEQQMRRGRYFDQPPYPFVPGYDLVGTVEAAGPGVPPSLLGSRVAALTKVGGWTTHAVLAAADLVAVPAGLDAVRAETVVVNGITAWQMLHRVARVRPGQVVLVHGVNGGVGSTLAQLARRAGVRVIGTSAARHHDAVRALGAEPVDYRDPDVAARVRELAPGGVDAVFDHLGGDSVARSWRLLARGGTLVAYGSASTRDATGSASWPVLKILLRTALWTVLPNGRRARLYNVWAGRRLTPARFRRRLRADLTAVLDAVLAGDVVAQVGARLPLERAAEALALAESGTVVGKVVLIPGELIPGELSAGELPAGE